MTATPQGLFTFPGLNVIRAGEFTLSHGISPSSALIEIAPDNNFAAKNGTLSITYGGTQIDFPDCRLDMASLSSSANGRTWSIRVLDRRWRWEFGHISGRYNQRRPSGNVNPATEKSPRDLAELLLKAMGESLANYDVSQLPNDTRPLVEWSYDNPAEQLARLCDSLGCRVVLGIDNKVRLCRLGIGATLPTAKISSGGFGFDPPEMPDSLLFVAGPTKYQMKFVLEAVGLDADGEIRLIKDLSYNPIAAGDPTGWANQYPDKLQALIEATVHGISIHSLAMSCVFRWYRIKEPATLDMKIPEYGTIKDIKQVLPISGKLLSEQTPIGERYPQPQGAYVEGSYYDNVSDPQTFVNVPPGTRYPGGFTIDEARGIVQFSNPVFRSVRCETDLETTNAARIEAGTQVVVQEGSTAYFPAELILTCTVNVRDYKTRAEDRFTKERSISNNRFRTPPKIVKRDDVTKTVVAQYDTLLGEFTTWNLSDVTGLVSAQAPPTALTQSQVLTNEKDTGLGGIKSLGVNSLADYYLDQQQATYQPKESLEYSYSAIIPINPDGVIHQVTWSVGLSGATTKASQNSEANLNLPSHTERRTLEILKIERERLANGGKPQSE